MRGPIRGGCLCGFFRFELKGAITEAGYCHCRLCQLATGSPVAAFATTVIDDYVVLSGQPSRRRSSDIGERWFCHECGTPLAMRVDHEPETIDFTIATLDSPELVIPTFHIWFESRILWFNTTDACARFDRSRSETPDLQTARRRS